MKDKRGIEIKKGQTVIIARTTGGFGAHELTDAVVQNVAAKMVRVGYTRGRDNEYREGNYYPNTMIVVELPDKA